MSKTFLIFYNKEHVFVFANSTKLNDSIQDIFKNWDNKILSHLPSNLDEIAKSTGILQRKHGIGCAVDLLRMLFLYASSNFSFHILAASAYTLRISSISDTTWRKQFSKAAPFLHKILHVMLSSLLPAVDIAHKLPVDKTAQARKRKTRKACKNQHRIGTETLLDAGWVVVITSLDTRYCGEEILHLYTSRWQVELLFKRFKQNFSIHTIEECKISFIQVISSLCLPWSLFVDLTSQKYIRYLSKIQRWRKSQRDEFYSAVLPGLLA